MADIKELRLRTAKIERALRCRKEYRRAALVGGGSFHGNVQIRIEVTDGIWIETFVQADQIVNETVTITRRKYLRDVGRALFNLNSSFVSEVQFTLGD